MLDTDKYKTLLERRLAYLEDHMNTIEDRLDDQPNPDWDDNAVEHEEDEVLEDLGEMDLREARAIRAALGRIKDGTYGQCVKCGDDIEPARLDLVPQTPFCKNCAK